MDEIRQEIEEKIAGAQKVLVGIGSEWKAGSGEDAGRTVAAAETLNRLLSGKDYYILTTLDGDGLSGLPFDKTHTAAPFDVSFTEEQWNSYMMWLSCTLNRETVILELGADFLRPDVMRWPFEKTAMLNMKAYLYRISEKFYQIPEELKEKATAVAENSVEFWQPGKNMSTEEKNGSDRQ